MPVRKAVVIVSHPRSGTHITLDFIRRNFPAFNARLKPWQSAGELYVQLDEPGWQKGLQRQARRSDHVLLQSHHVGMRPAGEAEALRELKPEQVFFIYPFRRFSATMRSFAAFCRYPGRVENFLGEPSRFFRTPRSVEACAREHAERWLGREAAFVNVEALLADPHRGAAQLGAFLGAEPAPLARRVPRRRLFQGSVAEMVERLTGRESTEVQVHYHKEWAHPDEPASVNARFADVYGDLASRSLV
jgi:hypothetical protein